MGTGVQTEIGSGGTRVKLLETSWSATPTPLYFVGKQDGTFNNTKVFAATYKVSVEGAFVPLVQTDASGATTVDKSQTITLKGTANLTFNVEPFLRIDWVGNPVTNADGTVSVQFKVTRGTTQTAFLSDVTDIFLFISDTQYDGNNNYDPRYSNQVTYAGTTGTALLGTTLTFTTKTALPKSQTYYLRVGARTGYGLKQYNYNAPKAIAIP